MIDAQLVTLAEASLLLVVNAGGLLLTALAWRVSEVDVREARTWEPTASSDAERARQRHNRTLITEDARYGEARRFQAHALIALVGLFWLLTPQPANPAVVWWAVAIRAAVIVLSALLIDKTMHHLIARWRFDRPHIPSNGVAYVWPSLKLAWRDMSALGVEHRT